MTFNIIEGSKNKQEKQLSEIKDEMRAITDTMYSFASGNNDLVIPVTENGLLELTKVLGQLMDERIQIERPKGLNEVKAQIENLIDMKERIESHIVTVPGVDKAEIENSIVGLVKERVKLERRLGHPVER